MAEREVGGGGTMTGARRTRVHRKEASDMAVWTTFMGEVVEQIIPT